MSRITMRGNDVTMIQVLVGDDQLELWRKVRDAVEPHGCYPVLAHVDEFDAEMWERVPAVFYDRDTTDRFSVLRAAAYAQHPPHLDLPVAESYNYSCTVHRFGHGPSDAELEAREFASDDDIDAFLFEWERTTFGDDAVIEQGTPDNVLWFEFEPNETVLLVLPVVDGAEAVKLLGFFPVDGHGEWLVPLANDVRAWEEQFGAELVCCFGTMLQFVVARPPTDLETAYQLATEHDIVASATLPLPGIQRRHYAADLIGRTRWHLHDRP